MTAESPMTLLRKHPFVAGMKEQHVEQLGALAREARFERNSVLFREEDASPNFYMIVSGMVALEITPPSGAYRVETLSGGDGFGWSSIMGQPAVFQARVMENLHALVLDAEMLRAAFEKDPAFGYDFMRRLLAVVSDRLHATRLLVMDSHWPVAKAAGA